MNSTTPTQRMNPPLQVWLLGATVGALVGMIAARLLWQQARTPGARPLDARQSLRVALIVLKALRQIAA